MARNRRIRRRIQAELPQHQGSVELINGAVIEHALCAISAAPESYGAAAGGGIIYAEDAIFRNNLKAVEYRSYGNSSGGLGSVIPDNVGKFINCTFSFDENNRFSVNGKTFRNHVSLNEVRGVTFEGCTFEEKIAGTAKRLPPENYGIYAIDAGYKVVNHCAKGGGANTVCPCHTGYSTPSSFRNLITGIRSENTGNPYDIYIDQSEFRNLNVGVRMDAQDNYRLTRNEFVNSETGLRSSNSNGYTIQENRFSAPLITATGISMNNSGSADNEICRNQFDTLHTGIRIQSMNGPALNSSSATFSLHGLQLIQNTFIANKYDIHILQGATVRPHQGSLSAGADNKFIRTQSNSIFSQSSQIINYYHGPRANCQPYNVTANVLVNGNAVGRIETDPCTTPSKSEIPIDSIEHYKKMQERYDKLLVELENNPKILQEILVLGEKMYELSSHAIHRIQQDSVLYLDALTAWYEVIRTPVAKYLLAEAYAFTKEYEKAASVLKNMPELFKFEETEMKEHDNYLRFFNFKKKMTLSDRNWADLKEDEVAALETIAQATCGRSATMAQGVLCFFFGNHSAYMKDCFFNLTYCLSSI